MKGDLPMDICLLSICVTVKRQVLENVDLNVARDSEVVKWILQRESSEAASEHFTENSNQGSSAV